METTEFPAESIQAYLKLIELNMSGWKPQVAAWLHSDAAQMPLQQLLAVVPCSPTLH